jgi:lactoylglutathione lyase
MYLDTLRLRRIASQTECAGAPPVRGKGTSPTRYSPYITPSFGPIEADMRATTKGGRTVPYPTAALPPRPSLSLLSDRAKALRKAHAAGDADAIERVLRYHPAHEGTDTSRAAAAELSTRDAQLVVAREHGFENWTQLKRYVDSVRHVEVASTRIGKAVPFFAVADMAAALGHYVDRLGFRMERSWAPDGQVRWCWLGHGPAALMLQQFSTEGPDARCFEGRRGAGGAFVVVADRAVDIPTLLDGTILADDNGYVLRDPHAVLRPGRTAATIIPVLDVSNLERSVAFFRDILGYREAGGAGGQTFRLQRDDADVVLRQETSPSERRGQGVSINHMCHDAIAYYREVTARGGSMTEPQVGNRLWNTNICDPDGWSFWYASPTDVDEEKRLSEVEAE